MAHFQAPLTCLGPRDPENACRRIVPGVPPVGGQKSRMPLSLDPTPQEPLPGFYMLRLP